MSTRGKVQKFLAKPLIGHMLTVGLVSLTVSLFGFYKETIVAGKIGLSELLDTFFIAILIPTFIQNVFVGGLKQLFIPNYLAEQQNTERKGSFQSVTFLLILCIIAILSLTSILFVEWGLELVFPNHEPNYYNLIRKQFYVILPCLVFWGLSSLLGGLLEIENKFLITSITPVFASLGTLIALFWFRDILGDYVLAAGILSGTTLGFLFLLFFTLKLHILNFGRIIFNANIKLMVQQLPHKITSSFLSGINPFVDQFFAAQLAIGSIGAINYGVKIPSFAVSISMLVLGNVLLPHFSKQIHQSRKQAYNQLFKVLKFVFIASAFCTLIGIALSSNIITFLFERDAFTSEDTAVVSNIQVIALIYVPFYLCTLVCVKFLTAINKNKFMASISFWNFLLNLFLNWWLIKDYGLYGLVASTTVVYTISSLVYFIYTYSQYKKEFNLKLF